MPAVDRFEFVTGLCNGKTVLDIGCVALDGTGTLHRAICAVAKECVGIDTIAAEGVIVADCQKFDLGRKFDVVVAGEVIEHLTSVQGFLESVKKHMRKDSLLVITTPNPYALFLIAKSFFRPLKNEPTHTAMYDSTVLRNLLARSGFDVVKVAYYHEKGGSVQYRLNNLLGRLHAPWNIGLAVIAKVAV